MSSTTLVFFDLETGGLDHGLHAITQIAAVAVAADSLAEVDRFEVKVKFRPENVDPAAMSLNSYNAETWEREAVHPLDACTRLSTFFQKHATVRMTSHRTGRDYFVAQLVGHNAATFDGPFLQAWYKRLDQFLPASYRVLCTLQRAVWHFQERPNVCQPESFKLGALCEHFGIPATGAHDALADVLATGELYRALRGTT